LLRRRVAARGGEVDPRRADAVHLVLAKVEVVRHVLSRTASEPLSADQVGGSGERVHGVGTTMRRAGSARAHLGWVAGVDHGSDASQQDVLVFLIASDQQAGPRRDHVCPVVFHDSVLEIVSVPLLVRVVILHPAVDYVTAAVVLQDPEVHEFVWRPVHARMAGHEIEAPTLFPHPQSRISIHGVRDHFEMRGRWGGRSDVPVKLPVVRIADLCAVLVKILTKRLLQSLRPEMEVGQVGGTMGERQTRKWEAGGRRGRGIAAGGERGSKAALVKGSTVRSRHAP
jgi:hypothetical protein